MIKPVVMVTKDKYRKKGYKRQFQQIIQMIRAKDGQKKNGFITLLKKNGFITLLKKNRLITLLKKTKTILQKMNL